MKNILWLVMAAIFTLLTGCSHVMSDAGLALSDRTITYSEIMKNPETLAGKIVVAGGVISEIVSSGDVTEFEITQLELLENGVPDELLPSKGRFIVVSGELLNPDQYSTGMLITVIGEIKGQRIKKLEATDYRYPIISAKEIKLFRASDLSPNRSVNPYQNRIDDKRSISRPAT